MTLEQLIKWFMCVPSKFDKLNISQIDIDFTRPIEDLNLLVKQDNTCVIQTLHRTPTYIDERKEKR